MEILKRTLHTFQKIMKIWIIVETRLTCVHNLLTTISNLKTTIKRFSKNVEALHTYMQKHYVHTCRCTTEIHVEALHAYMQKHYIHTCRSTTCIHVEALHIYMLSKLLLMITRYCTGIYSYKQYQYKKTFLQDVFSEINRIDKIHLPLPKKQLDLFNFINLPFPKYHLDFNFTS